MKRVHLEKLRKAKKQRENKFQTIPYSGRAQPIFRITPQDFFYSHTFKFELFFLQTFGFHFVNYFFNCFVKMG